MYKPKLLLTLLFCLMIQQSFSDENLIDIISDVPENVELESSCLINEDPFYTEEKKLFCEDPGLPSLIIQEPILDENADNDVDDDKVNENDEFSSSYLKVESILDNGNEIVLTDGSRWIIYSDMMSDMIWDTILMVLNMPEWALNKTIGWPKKEVRNFSHWKLGEEIKIQYPSSGNLIDFSLIIANNFRKEKAYIKLKLAPSIERDTCLSIIAESATNHEPFLLNNGKKYKFLDGMNWYGSALTNKILSEQKTWIVGDVITLIDFFEDDTLVVPYFGSSKNVIALWNHSTNEIVQCEEIQRD